MTRRRLLASFLAGLLTLVLVPAVGADCQPYPVGPNTPTGIAGCEVWGIGIGSEYGSSGVAMNFCTWTRRHAQGCGSVKLTAASTGLVVIAPVVDFCDCYTGTPNERIVDMLPGVVSALGLNPSLGLYRVEVWPAVSLPDAAMRQSDAGG